MILSLGRFRALGTSFVVKASKTKERFGCFSFLAVARAAAIATIGRRLERFHKLQDNCHALSGCVRAQKGVRNEKLNRLGFVLGALPTGMNRRCGGSWHEAGKRCAWQEAQTISTLVSRLGRGRFAHAGRQAGLPRRRGRGVPLSELARRGARRLQASRPMPCW